LSGRKPPLLPLIFLNITIAAIKLSGDSTQGERGDVEKITNRSL
jgi:hypothetical protein